MPPYRIRLSSSLVAVSAIAMIVLVGAGPRKLRAAEGPPAGPPAAESLQEATLRLIRLAEAMPGASPSAARSLLHEAEGALREREAALLSLLESRPAALREAALPDRVRASLPAELAGRLEREAALSGIYGAIIADDFAADRATMRHHLDMPGGRRIRLHLLDEKAGWPIGAELRVRGTRLGDHLVADPGDIDLLSTPSTGTASLAASQSRRVAVILFNFRNNTAQPWSVESARGIAFTSSTSASAYFAEASFGLLAMTGDVFGWYTIPYDNVNCASDYPAWSSAARAAAQAAGANLSGYTNFLYAFPSTSGCPGTGWANVGGPEAWLDGSFYTRLVAHELGHNYGTRHASSYSCVDGFGVRVPLSGLCSRSEYGDPFDVMGGSTNHFNNFHKGQAGWLVSSNTRSVTSSGLYTIAPLGPATADVQSLRIPRAGGEYLYLEYRRPYGLFDNFTLTSPAVNGVSIRMAPDYPTLTQSLLLDMIPSTSSYGDAPLPVGGTFEDPDTGAAITVVSADAAGAMVDVQLPPAPCARAVPGIELSPAAQWGSAGAALTYLVTLRNNDSAACAAASFTMTPSLPAGWIQAPAGWTTTLAAGQRITRTIIIVSSSTALVGLYTFGETVTHDSAPTLAASATAGWNVQPPDFNPPVVTILSPLNGTVLTKGSYRIDVTASDSSGIGRIDVQVDGTTLASCSGATTCSVRWQASGASPGTHTIRAIAVDRAWPAPNTASTSVSVITP